jgi:dihydrolipoamide dehydrogenase
MPINKYDIIVIGAGPAGYPCAIRLAQLKKKVLVVEDREIGGLCVNWGCIPTKALLHAAETADLMDRAKRMGFQVEVKGIDIAALRAWKENVVKRLRSGIEYLFRHHGVNWQEGRARIAAEKKVEVIHDNKLETFEADAIVIATGTEVVPLPGLDFDGKFITTTNDALALTDIPGSLLVIGAGASGLEMATIYSRLGSRVTVVEIMDQILPGMETELCAALTKIMVKSGITVYTSSSVVRSAVESGKVRATLKKPEGETEETFDRILVTVGRRPVTGVIKDVEIARDDKGYIRVDESLRTSIPTIYAIGDVTGPPLLAHRATHQGIACAEAIAGEPLDPKSHPVPSCVFTIPPLASVGITEKEARGKGIEIRIGWFPYRVSGKALAMGETEGLVKLIADPEGRLLGVHILGAESSSLIGEGVLALDKGLFADDLASAIHPHPSLSEIIMEAAANLLKKSINIMN